MEGFTILLLILGVVILIVLRMWSKAFNTPGNQAGKQSAPLPKHKPVTAPAIPSTSYKDILKEMQASGERAKRKESDTSLEKKYTPEKTYTEERSLEKRNTPAYSLETIPSTTKTATKKTSKIEQAREAKPKLPYPPAPPISYNRLLQNPQNVRTAFILSEIINRRFDY